MYLLRKISLLCFGRYLGNIIGEIQNVWLQYTNSRCMYNNALDHISVVYRFESDENLEFTVFQISTLDILL